MFGLLKPSLKHLSSVHRALYHASYCNLCAALSASGFGAVNRFFLVNDVVMLDWLLTETAESSHHPFACNNCRKGGVIGKKAKVTEHQKRLAAVCSFMVGIKLRDNAKDLPTLRSKVYAWAYFPLMRKARRSLQAFDMLSKLEAQIKLGELRESQEASHLLQATEPTEKGYTLLMLEAGKSLSTLPEDILRLGGRYFGRYVYLYDAVQDMDEDLKTNQYNVLNLSVDYKGETAEKEHAVSRMLDALKSMHLELFEKISRLPRSVSTDNIRVKWENVLFSIEERLFHLIHPLNSRELSRVLSSFAVVSERMHGMLCPMIDGEGGPGNNPCKGSACCKSPEEGGGDCCSDLPTCKGPEGGGCNPFN